MGGVHMASAVVAIRKTPAAMATTATCESACMLLCISILTPISQSDRQRPGPGHGRVRTAEGGRQCVVLPLCAAQVWLFAHVLVTLKCGK